MNRSRKGSVASIVVGVVALVVVAGVAWYFISDPFRTRANEAMNQMTKWTPEQIAKDPVNYLNFCEEQTKAAVDKLKASEIAAKMSLGQLQSKLTDVTKNVNNGEAGLTQLRDLYKKNTGNVWPVTWDGRTYDKNEFALQAKRFDREVQSNKSLQATLDQGVKQLQSQLVRIREGRDKADEQLAQIDTNRQILKVKEITGDLTRQLVNMKAVVEATVVTADETSKVVSLEQYTAAADTKVPDTEFEKLMGK